MHQMTVSRLLAKVLSKDDLSQSEAADLLELMLGDEVTDGQIAAFLVALAAKGEAEDELAGFASVMRARSKRPLLDSSDGFIDTCGTGGSSIKTFNVSTAAAFVVSAAGVPVAKHGNVAVTSRAGSADVLRALGVRIEQPIERIEKIFREAGICFMFAPSHHAATRRVAVIRRQLGIRTIFNWLGPLTNPAAAPFQVIGVSDATGWKRVGGALAQLGTKRSWVVRGEDGLDEISLAVRTAVLEVIGNEIRQFEVSPEDFGVSRSGLEELKGGNPEDNAALIMRILTGEASGPASDLVVINAAASIYVAGKAESLIDAARTARSTIESGSALLKLQKFVRISNED